MRLLVGTPVEQDDAVMLSLEQSPSGGAILRGKNLTDGRLWYLLVIKKDGTFYRFDRVDDKNFKTDSAKRILESNEGEQ